MSRHVFEYGTWESHYSTGENYDEGVGAFEFGVWHTQFREGLVAARPLPTSGSTGPRIPPGVTPRGKFPVKAVEGVNVKPAPQPREPGPSPGGPKPTPEGPKEPVGGRTKKKPAPKIKPADPRDPWLILVSGGFRHG